MTTQTDAVAHASKTMQRIDKVVREMHSEREGHAAEGYWTENTYKGQTMTPRQFVPTCCGRR